MKLSISKFLLYTSWILAHTEVVESKLEAAVILPHGDFSLDPSLLDPHTDARAAAEEVSAATQRAANWLVHTIDPDIIIVSTPHGQELSKDFVLYWNSKGSGYADIGTDLHRDNYTGYRIHLPTIDLNRNLTSDLLTAFQKHDQNVTSLLNFADSEPTPLRWGEVIPLWMLDLAEGHGETVSTRHPKKREYIVLSHPLRRYEEAPQMVPELLALGRILGNWARDESRRVAILISSDLSHTHRADGPYGYSNLSAPFDQAVGHWAQDPLQNAPSLLERARLYQGKAKSCGYTGLVLLHGVLSCSNTKWKSKVFANRNATYYGMMVATFAPQTEDAYNEAS